MTAYSKYNVIYRLQKWLDSVPGQTFLNYAYSWGASIVILGTLFKLTHLPGANVMLYLGMGTEVIVFFISAFDRPFDKTAIGKELPTHLDDEDDENESQASGVEGGFTGGGTIIIGGSGGGLAGGLQAGGGGLSNAGQSVVPDNGAVTAGGQTIPGGTSVVGGPFSLGGELGVNPEMEEATSNYVEELKKLTETLTKVSEQSERLTRDSEEMENLNRTLTGICKVYEMQLKGASAQIGTIDQINEQSRKMAEQIAELNRIYARMIEAMTANMRSGN